MERCFVNNNQQIDISFGRKIWILIYPFVLVTIIAAIGYVGWQCYNASYGNPNEATKAEQNINSNTEQPDQSAENFPEQQENNKILNTENIEGIVPIDEFTEAPTLPGDTDSSSESLGNAIKAQSAISSVSTTNQPNNTNTASSNKITNKKTTTVKKTTTPKATTTKKQNSENYSQKVKEELAKLRQKHGKDENGNPKKKEKNRNKLQKIGHKISEWWKKI